MYYIIATRTDLDCYVYSYVVGKDNEETSNYDNQMVFRTYEEAEEWTHSEEAAEWKDCTFDIVEDYWGYQNGT